MTPPKPCGTIAAYRRHLRAGERPCKQCTEANRLYMETRRAREEAKRVEEAAPRVEEILKTPAEVEADHRLKDLAWQRVQLRSAIAVSVEKNDYTRLAGLSRELREIWAEIEKINGSAEEEGTNDDYSNFDAIPLAPVSDLHSSEGRASTR